QDYDRGVIIGQRSYGKGLVQNTVDVGYNARLKLTTSKYYIPSGRSIQSVEYKNGEPVEVPEEKRVAYKTLNNRTVYDGGGIAPDLAIQHPDNIPVIQSILRQDLIFRFVSRNANNYKSNDISNLKFNDFDKFLAFIKEENIEFETEANKAWKEFSRKSKEEGYTLTETQKLVAEALEKEQKAILEKYKPEILNLIEKEIAARYFYASGRIKIGLRNDPEVKEAIGLLRQPNQYIQMLQPKK
ncbi:MAG: S41 family peptidase, partial [Bacteroidetes bacterium]|nr:S41 family peptidase [Bacteroidota bacterium]